MIKGLFDLGFLDSAKAMSASDTAKQADATKLAPVPVEFPKHLYVPLNSEGIDLRAVYNVPAATVNFEIMRFVAPVGAITKFIGYSIFNDGDVEANYDFKPLVNGNRVFRYHGHLLTTGEYKLALGLGPDLSNSTIINCQLALNPGDVLSWLTTNNSGVDTSMGVRMVGYFDTQITRVTAKFG